MASNEDELETERVFARVFEASRMLEAEREAREKEEADDLARALHSSLEEERRRREADECEAANMSSIRAAAEAAAERRALIEAFAHRPMYRVAIEIPANIYGAVVGSKYGAALEITKRYGVSLGWTTGEVAEAEAPPLVVLGVDPDTVDAAASAIELRAVRIMVGRKSLSASGAGAAGAGAPATRPLAAHERHVFIDFSNILIGAQHQPGEREGPSECDAAVHLSCRGLAALLEGSSSSAASVVTRIIAGSHKLVSPDILRDWEGAGYTARLSECDPVTRKERRVDAELQVRSKMGGRLGGGGGGEGRGGVEWGGASREHHTQCFLARRTHVLLLRRPRS